MPVYAKNPNNVVYVIPVLTPPVTLQPAGQDGSVVNVTSEMKGKTESEYSTLQIAVLGGNVFFSKTQDVTYTTPGLEIPSSASVFDDSTIPRAATATPASAVYFDALGQPIKLIEVDGVKGAFKIDFYGSIDCANVALNSKLYRFIGSMYGSDPMLYPVPAPILDRMRNFRFIKADLVAGIPPEIQFLSYR